MPAYSIQALMAEALFLAAPSQQAALEAPAEHSLILTAAESDLRQELSGLLVESGKGALSSSIHNAGEVPYASP